MCGIAGYILRQNVSINLEAMTNVLGHRGPDASGILMNQNKTIGFGHKRLSIIDLDKRSNQPFESQCGRFAISFNGEIYNFRELKAEILKCKSISFRTNSDTEVLIEGFALWGQNVIDRLNGMFAFSILDKKESKVWLVRDRMGIKPLFVFKMGGVIAWSSEMKSFQAEPYFRSNLKVNNRAIKTYLHLGYIPEPDTIYHQIEKFPVGTWRSIDADLIEESHTYWALPDKILSSNKNEEEQTDEFRALLRQSVRYRLISDVPFGTLLSGGVDSSLVTAIAAEQSDRRLETFSIGFKDKKYDESHYARAVSNCIGTNHHEFFVTEKESIGLIGNIISSWDEPFADSSAIPTMMISKMASKEVKMVLSGDGGDELFHGYGAYQWASRLEKPVIKFLRPLIRDILMSSSNNRYRRAASLFDHVERHLQRSHIFSQEQYLFSYAELDKLMIEHEEEFSYSDPLTSRTLTPSENQALFDLQFYLKDDLLVKVDRASMKYGLETRTPLLDHSLVEFSLNVAPELKMRRGESKYLMKKVLGEYLPKKLINRPKKGFSIPLIKWLRSELRPWLEENLDPHLVDHYGIIKVDEVKKLTTSFFNGRDYLYNRLWTLSLLHQWLKEKS